MATCGSGLRPKLLSPCFSASKSCAQLADSWRRGQEHCVFAAMDHYSLSRRDTPRAISMFSNSALADGLLVQGKQNAHVLTCVQLADVHAAVPATLAAPLRTRWFLSHPNEGVSCWFGLKLLHSEYSLLPWTLRFSKSKLPSELSLDICPSLSHAHR